MSCVTSVCLCGSVILNNSTVSLLHHSRIGKVGLKEDKALSSWCGDLSGDVLEATVSISSQVCVL